ncbi:MAG: hypothetical protein PHD48_05210 [Alphaproteobacteria bacterium]|nr:hypothetical protein [Alphaproteobacteria bacterium]
MKKLPELARCDALPPDVTFERTRHGITLPKPEAPNLQDFASPPVPPMSAPQAAGGTGLPIGTWIPPEEAGIHPAARQPLVFTSILPRKRRKIRIPRHKVASRFRALCVAFFWALAASIRKPAGRTR